jgi:cysteine desulfurase
MIAGVPVLPAGGGNHSATSFTTADLLLHRIERRDEHLRRKRRASTNPSQPPDIRTNGALAPRHPGNLNVSFPAIEADVLLQQLHPDVAASTGSACTSGQPEPSHVLRAIGLSRLMAAASIRFSIGRFTTAKDVDTALVVLGEALEQIEPRVCI